LPSSHKHKDIVTSTLAHDGVQCVLNTPEAPRWGGIWESAVTCVKLHLRRITAHSPSHFLSGRPFTTVPDPDLWHFAVGRLGYWQSIQAILQGLWMKWHQEYLTTLKKIREMDHLNTQPLNCRSR